MTDYVDFFLKSSSNVVQLELLEISHPAFTQTYYLVRNYTDGVTVTLEDSSTQFFTYYQLRMTALEARDDLDQAIRIDLGELGEVVPKELDAVTVADAFDVKPRVIYRAYRSDDLSAPMDGPIELEVLTFNQTRDGCSFEAQAPQLNSNKTCEIYTFERFPMLRGFL